MHSLNQTNECDRGNNSRRDFFQKTGAIALGGLALGYAGQAEAQSPLVVRANRASANLPNLYRGWVKKNFTSIQKHENAHVAFLVNQLGASARPKPTFQNLEQANVVQFARLSQAFENVGTKAYFAAAPSIDSPVILGQAASIALIEARHAGWLNTLLNSFISVGDESFESPLTQQQVVQAISPYVASLNSDIPLAFDSTPSPLNDVAILNFALALEYLEAEYYNINIPKFS